MKPQSPENSGENYSAADLPVWQAWLLDIKSSPEFSGGLLSRVLGIVKKLFNLQISMHYVFEI
jgi:hypothetical protein